MQKLRPSIEHLDLLQHISMQKDACAHGQQVHTQPDIIRIAKTNNYGENTHKSQWMDAKRIRINRCKKPAVENEQK